MLVPLLILLWGSATGAKELQRECEPSATALFESRALAYLSYQRNVLHVSSPPTRATVRAACRAIAKWSAVYWPDRPGMMDVCYRLRLSEDQGRERGGAADHGLSFSGWGCTLEVAKYVGERYAFPVPLLLSARQRHLEKDLDFSTRVALGELAMRLEEDGGNIEHAILHYKLGKYANIKRGKIRLKAWRGLEREWKRVTGDGNAATTPINPAKD